MATEKLIPLSEVKKKLTAVRQYFSGPPSTDQDKLARSVAKLCMEEVGKIKPVDAVSRGVLDQVRWERDAAIKQLEDHGIPFGGIAPDVVKVIRCKDCKHYVLHALACRHENFNGVINMDGFCSYGERKDNERKAD